MSRIGTGEFGPCRVELEQFMKCVKSHPKGLKETECDEMKISYRECMKKWNQSKEIIGTS